jgi:hypothetical protein
MLAAAIWLLAVLWILGNLFSFKLPGAIYVLGLISMFIVCVFGAILSIYDLYSYDKSRTSSGAVDHKFSVADPRFKSK